MRIVNGEWGMGMESDQTDLIRVTRQSTNKATRLLVHGLRMLMDVIGGNVFRAEERLSPNYIGGQNRRNVGQVVTG